MTTRIETDDLRRALEALWTDMGVLARSPLVEQLGLVEGWSERDRQDAYKRASALIEAILDAAQRLKSNGGEEAFALLDRVYGMDDEWQSQYDLPAPQPLVSSQIGPLDQATQVLRDVLMSTVCKER
jgi:hypothetical protein